MNKELTIEERFEWLANNKPKDFIFDGFTTWEMVVKEVKCDLYMYAFNNPIYCGPVERTDDEERHLFLYGLNVPRKL